MIDKQQIEEIKDILINSEAVTFGKNVQKPYGQYRYDKFFLSNNDGCLTVDYSKFAEALYNSEYRKVPKNAMVLTQEEYNVLLLEQKRLNKVVKHFQELIEDGKLVSSTQTRKETAKEIFGEIYKLINSIKKQDYEDGVPYYCADVEEFDDKLYILAKQCGVEVD